MGPLRENNRNAAIACVFFTTAIVIATGCGRSATHTNNEVPSGNYQIPLEATSNSDARQPDTVGLIFCLDVSRSMDSLIDGKAKIDISKNAMRTVFGQVESYVESHPDKKVQVGLVSFSGNTRLVVAPAPFHKARLERELGALRSSGGTAIGDAMILAISELHKSGVESRAIIVMTDGENNAGIPPEQAMQAIRGNQNSLQAPTEDVAVFLVAFDVKSGVFQKVGQAGASVVESRDEKSLQEMLNTVVEEVLLEKQ